MFLKRDHVGFYPTDCITNLKYYFNRPVSKYKVFTRHPNHYKTFYTFYTFFCSPSIRISGKSMNFDNKNINKSNFYKNKGLFNIHDLDVNKKIVSKKESYGTKNSFKYFIGYNDDGVIRPLCIKLPQMIGYVKHFDSNKTMSFKVSDNKLFKNVHKNMGKN